MKTPIDAEIMRDICKGYGREDVLLEGYPDRHPWYDFVYLAEGRNVTPEELHAIYMSAKQEAEQEKQNNPMRFYLQGLLDSMLNTGGEWYGSDFEHPIWIIKQVLALLEKGASHENTCY